MKAKPANNARSVVLAAGAGGYSTTTILLAVRLAASTRRQLRGLLVEDEDVLQLTGLPFTREISLTTARERPLEVEHMRRSMRAVEREFQRTLAREAHKLELGWSFAIVRGRLREIGLAEGREAALVIFEPQHAQPRVSPSSRIRRLLVVGNGNRDVLPALPAVLQGFESVPVELVLVGIDPDAITPELIAQGGVEADQVGTREISTDALADLLQAGKVSFDCAILPQPDDSRQLSRLLEGLRCPLVLVA